MVLTYFSLLNILWSWLVFFPTGHKLESKGKRKFNCKINKCLHQIVGKSWGISWFLIDRGGSCPLGRVDPGKVVLDAMWDWTEQAAFFMASASPPDSGFFSSCPDFTQWGTVTWNYKNNNPFLSQVAFGHGIYPSNKNLTSRYFVCILVAKEYIQM